MRDTVQSTNYRQIFGILYAFFIAVLFLDTNIFLVRRSYVEDAVLKKEFGKVWEDWSSKVHWRVMPYVL